MRLMDLNLFSVNHLHFDSHEVQNIATIGHYINYILPATLNTETGFLF